MTRWHSWAGVVAAALALQACSDDGRQPPDVEMTTLPIEGAGFPPPDDPGGVVPGDQVRITVTCPEGAPIVAFGRLVPQPQGYSLFDIDDIELPVDAGECTVHACVADAAGECVDFCTEQSEDVAVRPGVNEPVELELVCLAPFPASFNIRVGVWWIEPKLPWFEPKKDIVACGGFTELQFGFEDGHAPAPWQEADLQLEVSDPALADHLEIIPLGDYRFRIVALRPGPTDPEAPLHDGFIPLRATLTVEGQLRETFDTHVYVNPGASPECVCAPAEPIPDAVVAAGQPEVPRCRLVDDRIMLDNPALDGPDDFSACRATLPEPLDLSGIAPPEPAESVNDLETLSSTNY